LPYYCLLEIGDILLSLTGNVGRCCLVNEENLLLNQRVGKLQARNIRDWAFIYIMFRQASMKSALEELSKGTAQANLSPIETANFEMQAPPDCLLEKYSRVVTPQINKVLINFHHIRTLTRLRDALLPKLMSGELRVTI
jgi:type I restriction enzyme S subunit